MVEVKIIKSKKDIKNFIHFAEKLYDGCDYYVPSYYKHEMRLFSHKNPNLISNEIIGFLAYQEGKIVGRALCFLNRIDRENNPIVRISHLDFINDASVSNALLTEIENWAKTQNADSILGKIGFNDLECIGILRSNDAMATMQCKYNYPYYSEHLKQFGFDKCKSYKEYRVALNDSFDYEDNNLKLQKLLDDNNYKFVQGKIDFKTKYYAGKVVDLLYRNTLSGYPTVISEKGYFRYLKEFSSLIENNGIHLLVNNDEDLIGAYIVSSNTSIALQTTCGRVLKIKNMYSVDAISEKQMNLNLFVGDKLQKDIKEILLRSLASYIFETNIDTLNANLWLEKYIKSEENELLKIKNTIPRYLYKKNLKNAVIVKRDKSKMIVPKKKGSTSKIK